MLSQINKLLSQPDELNHVKQIAEIINDCLQENLDKYRKEVGTVIAAYALYKSRQAKGDAYGGYDELSESEVGIPKDILDAVIHTIKPEAWDKLTTRLSVVSDEMLEAVIFMPLSGSRAVLDHETPESIVKLSQRILSANSNEQIADICCGVGNFLMATASQKTDSKYIGYDVNVDAINFARIRAEFIDADIEFHLQNVFNVEIPENGAFDKIFANYPFGLKLRNTGSEGRYLQSLEGKDSNLVKGSSSEWIFNALVMDLLKEDGKAIGIMPVGCLWRTPEKAMRRYFVENGYVEAIIALPSNMFASTAIPTILIVLSRENNDVRFVDATDICQHGRRQNEFSDNDIEIIVEALSNDSEYSKIVSVNEIREEDYNLDFNRYFNNVAEVENGVEFKTVIKRITRGAPLTAKQLDQLVTKEMTDIQYLMLANIQDGVIQDDLPHLSKLDPKYEKYCLKKNDLILSKNGAPYKVAVAEISENQKVLANGNLYIIELDQEKVNPYYLKAFFDSEQGLAALKSITAGVALPNISMDNLKKLIVPLPELSVQNRVAQKYQSIMDEIAVYKLKMEKAENRLHHVFEEESGE